MEKEIRAYLEMVTLLEPLKSVMNGVHLGGNL